MVGPAGQESRPGVVASKLGFAEGQIVQEIGWDEDADDSVRFEIEDTCGSELEDDDFGDVVDAVLLWWRDDDGDLVDALVDALVNLDEKGFIALMTPGAGRAGWVEPAVVDESAVAAGLHATGTVKAGPDWTGTRLVAPKAPRR